MAGLVHPVKVTEVYQITYCARQTLPGTIYRNQKHVKDHSS